MGGGGGRISGGRGVLITGCIFCLQVDGPINGGGEGELIKGEVKGLFIVESALSLSS